MTYTSRTPIPIKGLSVARRKASRYILREAPLCIYSRDTVSACLSPEQVASSTFKSSSPLQATAESRLGFASEQSSRGPSEVSLVAAKTRAKQKPRMFEKDGSAACIRLRLVDGKKPFIVQLQPSSGLWCRLQYPLPRSRILRRRQG